jgi:Mg2+ and Co2+ transporter CorA
MNTEEQEERPPLFKNWRTWYMLVIGCLVLLILFFYFLTKHFS